MTLGREMEIILGLRDEFTSTMRKAGESLGQFERNSQKQWGSIDDYIKRAAASLSVYAAATKLKQFTAHLIDHARKIDTMSKSYQISTQRVQELEYVATQTGTSFERLANAQKLLNKNLDDMSRGKGRAQEHFRELGISAKEAGELLKDPARAFDEVGKRLVAIEDPGRRAAAAMKVFGEAGGEVLAALGDSGQDMDDAIERFRKLGLALDDKQIKAATDLGAAWGEVQQAFVKLGAEMLSPGMQELAGFLKFMATHSGKIREAMSWTAGSMMRGLASQLGLNELSLKLMFGGTLEEAQGIAALAEKLKRGLAGGAPAGDEWGEGWDEHEFGAGGDDKEARAISREEERERARREREIARIIERSDLYFMTEEEKLLAQFEREMSMYGDHADARTALEDEMQARLGVIRDKADKDAEAAAKKLRDAEGKVLKDRAENEKRRYLERLQNNALFSSAMTDLLVATLGEQHRVSKAFGIAEAIVNTHAGVTQALRSYPPPKSWALAAKSLAMGLQQVRAIRSASPGGGGEASISMPSMDFDSAPTPSDEDPADLVEPMTPVEERRPFTQEIHLHNVIGEAEWIRNNVAPTLRELQRDGMELIVRG